MDRAIIFPGDATFIGDTYCDDQNNNPDFNFDGGDCCVDEFIQKGKDNGYCTECRCKTLELDLKVSKKSFVKQFCKAHISLQYCYQDWTFQPLHSA